MGFALLFLVIGWLACTAYFYATRPEAGNPVSTAGPVRPDMETVHVRIVFDGDSGKLADGRQFRLTGIDAPEKDSRLADEARDYLKKLIERRKVLLQPGVEPKDKYGRTLAWMWINQENGSETSASVNVELVRHGYAYVYQFRPGALFRKELTAAQREARASRRGLWALPRGKRERYYEVSLGQTHRPGCKRVISSKKRKVSYDTFDEAVDTGAPPCRTCKP
jgi:micrococcal nuclease